MAGISSKFDIKAAAVATTLGLIAAAGAVALFLQVELRWLEVLFNLGVGIGTGLLYTILAERNGNDLEVGHAAGGGALCAIPPTVLLWGTLLGLAAALIGALVAAVLGAISAAAYAMRY